MRPINRIVFVDLNGRVATVNPDGSNLSVLTGSRRVFQFPSWSPKNAQIAAVGSNDNGGGLYLIADQTQEKFSNPELYFSHNQLPFYQYWAPDGKSISFLTTHPQGFGLRLAYLNGKSYLLTIGQPLFWSWTQEPDMIFIHSGYSEADARLTFIGTKGDGWGENIAQPGYFQVPGISSDGRFFAYAAVDAFGTRRLVVENSSTDERQQFEQRGMLALGWSPQESVLAFIATDQAEQRPYGPLTLVDPHKREARQVVDENVIAFFWSPDGQKIAYLLLSQTARTRTVTSADIGYSPKESMYTNGIVPTALALGEDDSLLRLELHLFDLQRQESRFLATITPPTTFLNQYLPFFDQYGLSHRLWSPDSQQLVMANLEGETAVLKVIPIDGGQTTTIAEGLMPSWSRF